MAVHAGLPTALLRGMWVRSTDGEHFTQVVDKIQDIDPAFPPGLIYTYQNLGITLLGHMVQVVTGRLYEEYVVDALFEPIGMNHSYIVHSAPQTRGV